MLSLSALSFLIVLFSAVPLRDLVPAHRMGYQVPSQRVVPKDISFEEKGAVHGVTEDGCRFSSTGWESSDGVGVSLKIYYCKSSAHAQSVLNKLTKEATKVFEKKTLTTKGRKTGERIVVTFSNGLIKRPEMIIWTKSSEINMVESTSFGHALAFEKQFADG